MNTKKWTLVGLGLTMAIALGGCNSISQREYDAAIDENTELRARISTLQGDVRDSDGNASSYQEQNELLRSENARLANELSDAQAQREQANRTGFEDVNGVDVSRRGGNGEVVVNIAGDVLFNSGSAELRNDAKRSLDQIAGVIKSTYGGNEVRIEGYTDSDKLVKTKKKWGTNENLSSARALAVESYLVSKGVSNMRVYSAAFGPAKPKGTKKESRRVEIVILGS